MLLARLKTFSLGPQQNLFQHMFSWAAKKSSFQNVSLGPQKIGFQNLFSWAAKTKMCQTTPKFPLKRTPIFFGRWYWSDENTNLKIDFSLDVYPNFILKSNINKNGNWKFLVNKINHFFFFPLLFFFPFFFFSLPLYSKFPLPSPRNGSFHNMY